MEILVFLVGFLAGALCVYIPFMLINKNNKSNQELMFEQMKMYFENTANKIFKESSSELTEHNKEKLEEFLSVSENASKTLKNVQRKTLSMKLKILQSLT